MREELLGYLLGALEPEERRELETRLETDADLRRELQELRRLLHEGPEEVWDARETAEIEPPPELAKRTCTSIDAVRRVPPPLVPSLESENTGRSRRSDAVTLIGFSVAALVVIMPMLVMSRQRAQIAACRAHMQEVGRALIGYSRAHAGAFPEMTAHGPLGHAGVYAVRLRQAGYLHNPAIVFCPAAAHDNPSADERLPSWQELAAANDEEVEARFTALHGLYGYTLGYVEDGRYHSPQNFDRAHMAVLGDAPSDDERRASGHGCGRNVWFEDGHAEFLRACSLHIGGDALYENRHGLVGAGIGKDDVVIGAPAAGPQIKPVKFEP
jgi:hypothetical protein